MAAAVATPLEKQFSTIAGLDAMTSSSNQGGTSITLQFNLARDIDAAAQDVQAAISKTLRQLPQGMLPPSYQKVNPADQPILYLALSSATLPLSTVSEYGETLMAQRISTISGVAQVQVLDRRSTPCGHSLTRTRWPRGASALMRPNGPSSRAISTDPPAPCTEPIRLLRSWPPGNSTLRRRIARSSSHITRDRRCA